MALFSTLTTTSPLYLTPCYNNDNKSNKSGNSYTTKTANNSNNKIQASEAPAGTHTDTTASIAVNLLKGCSTIGRRVRTHRTSVLHQQLVPQRAYLCLKILRCHHANTI